MSLILGLQQVVIFPVKDQVFSEVLRQLSMLGSFALARAQLYKSSHQQGQNDSTGGRMIAWHVIDLGLVPSILLGNP